MFLGFWQSVISLYITHYHHVMMNMLKMQPAFVTAVCYVTQAAVALLPYKMNSSMQWPHILVYTKVSKLTLNCLDLQTQHCHRQGVQIRSKTILQHLLQRIICGENQITNKATQFALCWQLCHGKGLGSRHPLAGYLGLNTKIC